MNDGIVIFWFILVMGYTAFFWYDMVYRLDKLETQIDAVSRVVADNHEENNEEVHLKVVTNG